jgi:hypothetical protein
MYTGAQVETEGSSSVLEVVIVVELVKYSKSGGRCRCAVTTRRSRRCKLRLTPCGFNGSDSEINKYTYIGFLHPSASPLLPVLHRVCHIRQLEET